MKIMMQFKCQLDNESYWVVAEMVHLEKNSTFDGKLTPTCKEMCMGRNNWKQFQAIKFQAINNNNYSTNMTL